MTNPWLEIDFAEFLGLDRVMTPVEIDELTEKLNDEVFFRGIDSALTVKKEFVIAYLQDLLDDYSRRKYSDPRKIEMQFEIVRNLREALNGIKSNTSDIQKSKALIKRVNGLLADIS